MRCFYAPKHQISDDRIKIIGAEFHHIINVVRLKKGDEITVLDGEGGIYDVILTDISKKPSVAVGEIKSWKQVQRSALEITLVQAITKLDSMDIIIQKATELGVYEIIPVICKHSVPNLSVTRSQKRIDRWRQIAISASKQSGRPFFPLISDIKDFQEALNDTDAEVRLIFVAPSMTYVSVQKLKDVLKKITSKKIQIIIGPEGDFTKIEIDYAISKNAVPVSLGDNILRTETASISALAIVSYEMGD